MGRQWRRSWEETLSRFVHLPEPRISHLYKAPTPPDLQGTEWQRGRGVHIKCPAWCALRGQVNAGAAVTLMLLVKGCFFLPLFPTGPSRRSCSPAQKACALEPQVRGAILIATCSWPWSCLPKSWRSGSSSKSYSCLSRRNRPFCSQAAKSRASGLHTGAASLVPWG